MNNYISFFWNNKDLNSETENSSPTFNAHPLRVLKIYFYKYYMWQ